MCNLGTSVENAMNIPNHPTKTLEKAIATQRKLVKP